MLLQLILFPFGYFIALGIGAYSGWYFAGKVHETEDNAINLACIFAVIGFCCAFFFTLSAEGMSILKVIGGLILCGLAGPIVAFCFWLLLTAGFHFRLFRQRVSDGIRQFFESRRKK